MKRKSLLATYIITIVASSIFIDSCKVENKNSNYLQEVLQNLEQIESATYYVTKEAWAPGDTAPLTTFQKYCKEYHNPDDTTIGSSFINLNKNDTTTVESCYDGYMLASFFHDQKGILIDSFKVWSQAFRPITPPFYNYTKSIIQYANETNDSILINIEDLGDSVYFKLQIFEEKQVFFFGKAYFMPDNPYNSGEKTSIYELWISKSDDLPYKVRMEMSDQIFVMICKEIEINKVGIGKFKASDYFPPDYELREYIRGQRERTESTLTGKVAPDWVLNDANEQPVALKDLKSKILLINFTGIGCGPCQMSIPFLKELVNDLNGKSFELIAIESWARNPQSLKNHTKRNSLNYKLLEATDDVIGQYQTNNSVPVFFIIDENRIIRKVIIGYSETTTGKEIRDAINDLI